MQVANTPNAAITAAGQADNTVSGGVGGLLNNQKDAKEAQTAAQFGDVMKNMQARYGAKDGQKAREIKKNLGKDDFLRIMITQMKNQDPTSPFKAEQMAEQIAQFTSVEQLQNMNQHMAKMATANQPLERLAMTSMIGKTVTVDRERFPHTENQASNLSYTLMRDARDVKLSVLNDQGEQILTKDLGPMKQGEQSFAWDGFKSNSMAAKTGNYLFRIEAVDEGGRPIPMNAQSQAAVVGVSFEGGEGVLLVGDPNSPQKVGMKSVIRVDSNSSNAIPGVQSLKSAIGNQAAAQMGAAPASPSPQGAQPAATSNQFMFRRGEGSSPIAPSMAQAIGQYQAAESARGQNDSTNNIENNAEKGFANGLSASED